VERITATTERVMRPAFGCALVGGGMSPAQSATWLSDIHVRPAYLSNVSRGSAVV
jgi:phage baseplate assembly protein W